MVVNETHEPKPKIGNVNLEPLTVNTETLQDLSDETQKNIAGGQKPAAATTNCTGCQCPVQA